MKKTEPIKRIGSEPQKKSSGQGSDIELYPSEMNNVRDAAVKLQKKFGFKSFSEHSKVEFTAEAEDLFRAIGLIVRVSWDLDVSGGTDRSIFYMPTLEIVGRTSEVQIDHERMSYEVASGEYDGQQGYIREDGSKHTDPIKKSL